MASLGDEEIKHSVHWEFCTSPPDAVAGCQSVILDDKLFISGQYTSSSDLAKMFVLHLSGDGEWNVLAAPASLCGVTTYMEELVLVGGKQKDCDQRTNKLWNSRDAGETWLEELPPMPTDRDSAAAVNIGKPECILVAGGERVGGRVNTVEIMSMKTWWTLESLPLKTSRLKTAIYENTLFLLGGYKQKIAMFFSKVDTIMASCTEQERRDDKQGSREESFTVPHDEETYVGETKQQDVAGADEKDGMVGATCVSHGSDDRVTGSASHSVWSNSFAPLRSSCCASDGKCMVTCGQAYFSHEPPKIYCFSVETMSWTHLWFLPDKLNAISLATFLPSGELMAMDWLGKVVKGRVPVAVNTTSHGAS